MYSQESIWVDMSIVKFGNFIQVTTKEFKSSLCLEVARTCHQNIPWISLIYKTIILSIQRVNRLDHIHNPYVAINISNKTTAMTQYDPVATANTLMIKANGNT